MGYRKLASWTGRFPKLIIGVWVLFFVLSSFYAVRLPSVLKGPGLTTEGSFSHMQEILANDFHIPKEPVILVFEKKKGISQDSFTAFIGQTLSQLQYIDGVNGVVSPLTKNGMMKENWAYAILSFRQEPYAMGPVIDQIRSRLPHKEKMTVKLTGQSVVQQDVNRASQADLKKAERIGIPIALFVLILAFRGVSAAIIPLCVGMIAVTGTMGIMYEVGTRQELSIFVLNVIPMVGLALSVDFALLLISRFRVELSRRALGQALSMAMETAGKSIVLSGICVFLGLVGTFFIHMPIINTVALGAIIVLFLSVLVNLTLLPALLWTIEPRIGISRSRRVSLWHFLARFVMKRPIRMTVLSSLILATCVLPLFKMSVVIPDASSLPQDYESRQTDELYKKHFTEPGTSQVYLLAEAKNSSIWQSEELKKIDDVIQRLHDDPLVSHIDSIFTRFQLAPEQLASIMRNPQLSQRYAQVFGQMVRNNRMLIQVTLRANGDSKEAMDWVRRWEQKPQPISLIIGGEPKYQQEVFDEIFLHLREVFLFVFLSNFIVLLIAFRSLLIPIKTIFLNLISLAVSFGILSWTFEQIAIMIPVFIFGLVFGISMDYGVFLLSRIYEIYLETEDNDQAVLVGLSSTSRLITSAAAIMIAVTGSFASAGVVPVKQLGIGIAAAIFIDATIIRMILVPSLMKLLGSWNWWTPWGAVPRWRKVRK